MDTETKPVSFDDKLKLISKKIDDYYENKLLTLNPSDSEIDDVFSLTHKQLESLSAKMTGEYAFILAKYAASIKKELNKEKAILNWVKKALDFVILPKVTEMRDGRFITFDELKVAAIKDNDLAMKINKCVLDIETNVIAIEDLNRDIIKMSDRMSDLQRTKSYGTA